MTQDRRTPGADGISAQDAADNAAYVRAVHDRGLAFDLRTMSRRSMLGLAGGLGAFALVGCGSSSSSGQTSSAASSSTPSSQATADSSTAASSAATSGSSTAAESSGAASCAAEINTETNGPYPADGSNGIDIRTASGIVRTDITSSFGTGSATAAGVPLNISFVVQDLSCQPLAKAAVYVWHCDQSGNYSLYSSDITSENYLRGIAETDSAGKVTFSSIFPACYSGRWPHIHFEVYKSLAEATSGSGSVIKTSQIALPENSVKLVYATSGYSSSVTNLSQVTLASDNVFGDDGGVHELGTVTGSVSGGFAVSLTLSVDPDTTETGNAAPSGSDGRPSGAPSGAPPSGGPGGAPPGGPPPSGAGAPPSS